MSKAEIESELKTILERMRAGTATVADMHDFKRLKFALLTKV